MGSRVRTAHRKGDTGFTLVELLVVISVIGTLTGLAIPGFGRLRNGGYDAAVQSDLRQAASAEEAFFTENNIYSSQSPVGIELTLDGFHYSSKSNYNGSVALITPHLNPAGTQYCLTATSRSGQSFVYSSISGLLPRNRTCSF